MPVWVISFVLPIILKLIDIFVPELIHKNKEFKTGKKIKTKLKKWIDIEQAVKEAKDVDRGF